MKIADFHIEINVYKETDVGKKILLLHFEDPTFNKIFISAD